MPSRSARKLSELRVGLAEELYTGFGRGDDEEKRGPVGRKDVARYVSLLTSDPGDGVRGRTIHLDSLEPLGEMEG